MIERPCWCCFWLVGAGADDDGRFLPFWQKLFGAWIIDGYLIIVYVLPELDGGGAGVSAT